MNARGQYGASRVGQIPQATPQTVYVERGSSWILGAFTVVGTIGSVLWARHQSQQIKKLYKTVGLPYQSFPESLRQGVGSLSSRASTSLHDLAERVRPKKAHLLTREPEKRK